MSNAACWAQLVTTGLGPSASLGAGSTGRLLSMNVLLAVRNSKAAFAAAAEHVVTTAIFHG